MKYVLFALVSVFATHAMAFEPGALEISESESNRVMGADIQLTRDWKIVAKPASHHQPVATVFQIQESDNCDYKKVSDSQFQLGSRCEFLSGVYSYVYQSEGSAVRHQVVVGFSVSKPRSEGRIFMVSAPLDILEKK